MGMPWFGPAAARTALRKFRRAVVHCPGCGCEFDEGASRSQRKARESPTPENTVHI